MILPIIVIGAISVIAGCYFSLSVTASYMHMNIRHQMKSTDIIIQQAAASQQTKEQFSHLIKWIGRTKNIIQISIIDKESVKIVADSETARIGRSAPAQFNSAEKMQLFSCFKQCNSHYLLDNNSNTYVYTSSIAINHLNKQNKNIGNQAKSALFIKFDTLYIQDQLESLSKNGGFYFICGINLHIIYTVSFVESLPVQAH